MALQDYFYDGMDSATDFASTTYHDGQTFTAGDSYTVDTVVLKLYRHATTDPGNVTAYIYATSGSLPTGSALATSAAVSCSGITTSSPGEEVTFTFAAGPALTNGTEYAIVILASNSSPCLYWRVDGTSATYAGGQAVRAGNPTWYENASIDHWFEVYDAEPTIYTEGTKTVTAAASVELASENYIDNQGAVPDRPTEYDGDKYWDEETGTWTTTRTTHPGNWSQNLLTISEEGEIYFRTI